MYFEQFLYRQIYKFKHQLKHSVVEYALTSTLFKESANRLMFRLVISFVRSQIMFISCFSIPFSNVYLKFSAEILTCVIIQTILNKIIPLVSTFEKNTACITNFFLKHVTMPYFWLLFELYLYFVFLVFTLCFEISNQKLQYLLVQQTCLCIIFDYHLFLKMIIGQRTHINYFDFEIINHEVFSTQSNDATTDRSICNNQIEDNVITMKINNNEKIHIKVLQNYF